MRGQAVDWFRAESFYAQIIAEMSIPGFRQRYKKELQSMHKKAILVFHWGDFSALYTHIYVETFLFTLQS